MDIRNRIDSPAPPPASGWARISPRVGKGAALGGAVAAIASGWALFHVGVFWQGVSVSQAHQLCSSLGGLVVLGGQSAVTTCSDANTAYLLLMAALVISVLVALAGVGWLVATRRTGYRQP
jgi:hypothetical protein